MPTAEDFNEEPVSSGLGWKYALGAYYLSLAWLGKELVLGLRDSLLRFSAPKWSWLALAVDTMGIS